jgi:hypothetical protein
VSLLRDLGYTNLRHYRGGLADWRDNGGPLETATRSPRVSGRRARISSATAPRDRRWGGVLVDLIERQSTSRLFLMWLGMIAVCSIAYWLSGLTTHHGLLSGGQRMDVNLRSFGTAVYFSFVTATSVGYGDVVPIGAVRILAITEAVAGLLIFGAVVAKFVSRRQDELVREIHRVTFEERLDRVQTNLHLVLSEMQAIAAMCDDGKSQPERAGARLESVTLVFAGELRAIHDLLYRPQWAPEEAILGAILASLAAALHELREVLACLPATFPRTATLQSTLATLTRVADEICGDCVPHAYAPALRVWMDRVQETARSIA